MGSQRTELHRICKLLTSTSVKSFSAHLDEISLETIAALLLSDHGQLLSISLRVLHSLTKLISKFVSILYTTYNYILSTLYDAVVVPPPLNVQASQSGPSAPVEVSWSPPSGGAATIAGYRIFYSNGEKNIYVVHILTGINLNFKKDVVGQTISIRSEVDEQLISELIDISIKG